MSNPQRLANPSLGFLFLALVLGCGGKGPASATPVAQDCRGGKIWHDDDAQRFIGCEGIDGDLKLGGALRSASAFESLVEIRGSLEIGPSYQLQNLSGLSKLQTIGGALQIVSTQSLLGLFLPKLRKISGEMKIRANLSLQTVSLHTLLSVQGAISVDHNRELSRLDLSALAQVGGESVIKGQNLQSIVTPAGNDWQKAPTKPAMPVRVY